MIFGMEKNYLFDDMVDWCLGGYGGLGIGGLKLVKLKDRGGGNSGNRPQTIIKEIINCTWCTCTGAGLYYMYYVHTHVNRRRPIAYLCKTNGSTRTTTSRYYRLQVVQRSSSTVPV